MTDYMKLQNYLNENKTINPSTSNSSLNSGIESMKQSMSGFFSKANSNSITSDPDQMDSWFKEADNDQYCPKLVSFV
jgi:hypothetical protein